MIEPYARPAENSPFVPGTAIQFAWDSTSIGWLMQCPHLYQRQMIEGYFPKGINPHLKFGLVFHSALELFDRLRVRGVPHEEAVLSMVRHALEKTGEYIQVPAGGPEVNPPSQPVKPTEDFGQTAVETLQDGAQPQGSRRWKPWLSEHAVKNRETLVRTLVWYSENYRTDPIQTYVLANGEAAVELSFRFEIELVAPNGEPYLVCGHLDKVGHFGDGIFVLDKKTSGHQLGDNFFGQFDLDNQMSLYTMAGKLVLKAPIKGVMIDGAQVAVGFSAFLRGMTTRTDEKLAEWMETVQDLILQNETWAAKGSWPRNYKSCNNFMEGSTGLGGCPMKKVCSRQPSQRESVLKTEFIQKRWNPIQPRTEDRKD